MAQFLRLIILFIGIWLVIRLIRRFLAPQKPTAPTSASSIAHTNMLPCARCGVYIPYEEAYKAKGQYFCCQAHADEAKKH